MEEVSFALPDDATEFDISGAEGKTVAIVNLTKAVPILAQWEEEILTAFEGTGVETTVFDGNFQPSEWARGIDQAISQGVDLIITIAIPAPAIEPQIAAAKKAGIPLIVTNQGVPQGSVEDFPDLAADVGFDYRVPGKLLGEWFCADSGGTGNAVIISSDDNTSSPFVWGAIEEAIAANCPDATHTREDSPVPEWGDGTLQQRAKALVLADPTITHFLAVFDGATLAIEPGLVEIDAQDDVSIAGFNGAPAVMSQVKNGTAIKMEVGAVNMWFSAGTVDTALRLLTGNEIVQDYEIPFRIFTEDNVSDLDTSREDAQEWFGVDPLAEFRTLWGV
jgi:ribose transport system substrate-binding protein